jgi:NAD(P)-dependent dehydrogenase (short-subunit alcohol dehydrogenase family)
MAQAFATHPTPSTRPVVLITGAAHRLGLEMALTAARAGFDVAVHHHRSAPDAALQALQALGATAHSFAVDLMDEAACEALPSQVLARFGRLDAVVHNASLFDYDDVQTCTHTSLQRHWQANTAPAIVLGRALHAHLATRNGRGCVVTLLDQKLWNQNPDYFSYTLSKAALETAMQLMARALAPSVRVCGVAPGVTLPTQHTMNDATFEAASRMTVLQYSSTPQDIANAVLFLLQSPAITGTSILVDGGQHLMGQARDVAFLADKP